MKRASPSVTVLRYGQFIAIQPATESVTRCVLEVAHTARHGLHASGNRLTKTAHPLVDLVNDPTGEIVLKCPCGLAPLVLEHLQRRGFCVRGDRVPQGNLNPPDLVCPDDLAPPDQALLEFVEHHDR